MELKTLFKDIADAIRDRDETIVWKSEVPATYATSNIDAFCNETFYNRLDLDVQSSIKPTMFYFTPLEDNTDVSTLERKVFIASANELGLANKNATPANIEGDVLPHSSAYDFPTDSEGNATSQWTRTPSTSSSNKSSVIKQSTSWAVAGGNITVEYGFRPCFTLPETFVIKKGSGGTTSGSNKAKLKIVPDGTIIKLNEGGVPVDFFVAKHDYESELNGAGRVLVVRRDCMENVVWNTNAARAYSTSNLDSWLNKTYKTLLDSDLQEVIGSTKFYSVDNSDTVATVLERAIFTPSFTEYGFTYSGITSAGETLPIFNMLRVALRNGVAVSHWTRSPRRTAYQSTNGVISLDVNGKWNDVTIPSNTTTAPRPCFTLPEDFEVEGLFAGNGEDMSINYSLEEQKIGTWVDGKPLYMRTAEVTGLSSDFMQLRVNSFKDVDTLVELDGYIKATDGTTYPLFYEVDGKTLVKVEFNGGSSVVEITEINSKADDATMILTAKYTKTTDQRKEDV